MSNAPAFDRDLAARFLRRRYRDDEPAALILGFTEGVFIPPGGPDRFDAVLAHAERERTHLFFHVATLKPEWADPKSHAKGKVTTATKDHVLECPYLWLDCDAEKYTGDDPAAAKLFYANEGSRVWTAITKALGSRHIVASDMWRSGAGWQALIRLDRALLPAEAEELVGRLHAATGFDAVVRNCNRILRVPGSINWKTKDGRVPAPCNDYSTREGAHTVEEMRAALTDVALPAPVSATKANIEINWDAVAAQDLSWLTNLPADFSRKGRLIIEHEGTLADLNATLKDAGLLDKSHTSWSTVTLALAAVLKTCGLSPEMMAAVLMAPLPCNSHIARQKNKRRAVERALNNSFEPTPKGSVDGKSWPDGVNEQNGVPLKGYANTLTAITRLGIDCHFDVFRQKEFVHGHEIHDLAGEVSDAGVTMLRHNIRKRFGFYPEKATTQEAVTVACRSRMVNPVLDYFDSLPRVDVSKGTPLLDKMLHRYMGADDTPLNAAIGRKLMCAIVRRARQPGSKWDYEPLLQGAQGIRKSMFCEDLAIFPDLYTDTSVLTGSVKEQMEIMGGKQIVEIAEMAGFGQITREKNKAFRTRKVDRARMAYDRYAADQPRASITISTTNEKGVLNDSTGERRYWPVLVRHYDREAFLRDKDALYAEAVAAEPTENLWLDTPELAAAHADAVAEAKVSNDLVDLLSTLEGTIFGSEERVSIARVREHLGLTATDAARDHRLAMRITDAMTSLGWEKPAGGMRCTHLGLLHPEKGFRRPITPAEALRRNRVIEAYMADAE